MGRAPRGRRECEDERTQPAKRPANWEGELPEDPILASQLPKVSKASGARGLVDRPPTAVKKVPKIQESGGSKAPGLQQYDLLAALGIKRRSTGEETEPKRQKKETRTPMQLFQQLATKMWKPKKHPPLEGIIEERSEGNLQELGSTSEVPSFQVRLKTSGPGPAKRVTFSGAAARAFHRSLGLQRGGRIQIQGYTSSVRDGMEELHFQDVHPGVCIKVVATAAMSTSEEVLQLGDLVKHLEKVKSRKAKAVVTVEAIAKQIGKLQHEELAMQPGEFAAVRSIELQCPSSNTTCQWRLWDAQAEQFGEALKGHRLRINGTRVRDAHGQPELTGCASMSITS